MADLAAELQAIVAAARRATMWGSGGHMWRACPECGARIESHTTHAANQFTAADAAMTRHLITCEPFIARLAEGETGAAS